MLCLTLKGVFCYIVKDAWDSLCFGGMVFDSLIDTNAECFSWFSTFLLVDACCSFWW